MGSEMCIRDRYRDDEYGSDYDDEGDVALGVEPKSDLLTAVDAGAYVITIPSSITPMTVDVVDDDTKDGFKTDALDSLYELRDFSKRGGKGSLLPSLFITLLHQSGQLIPTTPQVLFFFQK